MQLTKDQRIFIVTSYNTNKCIHRVREEFKIMFPERALPTRLTIRRTIRKFNTKATLLNLNKGNSGRLKTIRNEENIERIRQKVIENRNVSSRRNPSGLAKSSFHNIIKKDLNLFPYKMQVRQQLLDADLPRRIMFCEWFLNRLALFVTNLVVTDEAAFHVNGSVNKQNNRYYSEKNSPPVDFTYDVPFNREKVSVWMGLCGNGVIIGPIFYRGNLTGDGT